ncbi:hypothetical protein P9X10_00370 [Bacillus cereus]|nr:hypothetical protein [Bacillus cereus]
MPTMWIYVYVISVLVFIVTLLTRKDVTKVRKLLIIGVLSFSIYAMWELGLFYN